MGNHVATSVKSHEAEVAAGLESTNLLVGVAQDEIGHLFLVVSLLAGPLESLSPGLVAEPIANIVGITSVDENRDLLKDAWDQSVEWLHPVTLEEEVTVDIEVAALVGRNLGAKRLLHFGFVEIGSDPLKIIVAQAATLALTTDIVDVLAGSLIGTNHGIVAVD